MRCYLGYVPCFAYLKLLSFVVDCGDLQFASAGEGIGTMRIRACRVPI